MWEILLPLFGLLVGILAAMTGVGGGIIIVPLLTLLYFFPPATAIGTSLATIFFTAIAATFSYSKQKIIYYKTGIAVAIATSPGAVIGAYLTTLISPSILGVIFGVFLIMLSSKILYDVFFKRQIKIQNVDGNVTEKDLFTIRANRLILCVFLGFFAGVASGLLGVGGGFILVPIMMYAIDLDVHVAVATSMFTMIFTSIFGVGQHFLLGNINFEFAILLGAGSVIGAQIGAYIGKRTSSKNLRGIFAIILFLVSIQMIAKFL